MSPPPQDAAGRSTARSVETTCVSKRGWALTLLRKGDAMNENDDSLLESTGERLMPSDEGDAAIEHLHRYAIAVDLAEGKTVLDVACGEGYGSFLLSQKAARVVGVDLSPAAIEHAQMAHPAENLEFLLGSCTDLPLEADSVDMVVSFETIEHIEEQERMLEEIRRVLRPDGVLLISTPDREVYTSEQHRDNPFHVRELSRDEFARLIGSHFPDCRLYRQRLVRGSLVVSVEGTAGPAGFRTLRGDFSSFSSEEGLSHAPYLIALAGPTPPPRGISSYFESPNVKDDLVKELAQSRGRVLELQGSLVETQSQLIRTQGRLIVSHNQKDGLRRKLSDTKRLLVETRNRLLEAHGAWRRRGSTAIA